MVATRGILVEGKSLTIIGSSQEKTIIVTNAGYGVLFHRSLGSAISNLTITGGIRDTSGMATDGGIVAKFSRVRIENVIIRDDTSRAENVVVGIGGIVGREESELSIQNCIIRNNGWDGIALYRGATAFIADNVIEEGRGAGIGITWDASAVVFRNRVSGYWKGIGTFGSSWGVVRNNAIFDNLGWGIVVAGSSFMDARNNVVASNGNCGVAPWDSSANGVFVNNIIVSNGFREEWVCPQVGYWMNGMHEHFSFRYNNVWSNVKANFENIPDQTGMNGNLSVDPQFVGEQDFRLRASSQLRNAGDPTMKNRDGSRSHIGIEGGEAALGIRE